MQMWKSKADQTVQGLCISSSNISRGTAFQIILDQVVTDGSFRKQVGYNLNRKSLYGIDVAGES